MDASIEEDPRVFHNFSERRGLLRSKRVPFMKNDSKRIRCKAECRDGRYFRRRGHESKVNVSALKLRQQLGGTLCINFNGEIALEGKFDQAQKLEHLR